MTDDTIRTRAAVGGREITLDPVMEREPLLLPVRRVENTIPCGFRVNWFDGEHDLEDGSGRIEYNVDSGAGCGSRWLTLVIKMPDGTYRYECADMAEFAQRWLQSVLDAGPTPEVT